MWFLALLTLGCGGTENWSTTADCEAPSSGSRQDECWAKVAPSLFRADPEGAERIVATQVGDPRVRDYIWLTVTREVDPGSYKYCDKIEEAALEERCRVLVSRPHLHRELLKGEGGQGGPPGAGPPGGGPPGAGPPGGGPPPGGAPPPGGGAPAPVEGSGAR